MNAPLQTSALPQVLVVDDSRTALLQVTQIIKQLGMIVLTASDGIEALEVLKSTLVDVVLTDIDMPRMDGHQLLYAILADPELRHLPVVVLSGHNDVATVARCIELGAADALPKPCHEVLLRARLESCLIRKRWHDEEKRAAVRAATEVARSGQLLANMLPDVIAERLKAGERAIADYHPEVSILFADIVGFTPMTVERTPAELVAMPNALFSMFDVAAASLGLEKIKTVGDAYMVAAGIPTPRADHAQAVAALAVEMHALAARLAGREDEPLRLHVGIHSGGLSAGIIGTQKFSYDVWGDTVNIASRLTDAAPVGGTLVSAATAQLLAGHYQLRDAGSTLLKGRGQMQVFQVGMPLPAPEPAPSDSTAGDPQLGPATIQGGAP
jgi:class 3 adenylate cyclase